MRVGGSDGAATHRTEADSAGLPFQRDCIESAQGDFVQLLLQLTLWRYRLPQPSHLDRTGSDPGVDRQARVNPALDLSLVGRGGCAADGLGRRLHDSKSRKRAL